MGDEGDRLYARRASLYPSFAQYQRQTKRIIPVIALIPRPAESSHGSYNFLINALQPVFSQNQQEHPRIQIPFNVNNLEKQIQGSWIRIQQFPLENY
jgi:hypothetical protein